MKAKIIASTKLRENLADILDAVNKDQPVLIISRRGKQEHAIVDLDKLEDLLATGDPDYLKDIAESRQQAADGELFALEDVLGNL